MMRIIPDMAWRTDIITLYPEMFPGPLGISLAGRALAEDRWQLNAVNLRDFAIDAHRSVDDTPAGGGPGMVLRADILLDALDVVAADRARPRLLMSPRGKPLTQSRVHQLAEGAGPIIVCGRFEGIDQRAIDGGDLEEVSVGDYILSGGELAAMTLIDACVRLLPGVMGNAQSGETESFENGLLEHPHYTRPAVVRDMPIPSVLTSGHHGQIDEWRRQEAINLTAKRRPELLADPKNRDK
jgi:tRNA (guanine37-N1)-methyltransferase